MLNTLNLETPAPGIEPIDPRALRMCATPGCDHRVAEPWDESGKLCPDCAVQQVLADRTLRWSRVYPA